MTDELIVGPPGSARGADPVSTAADATTNITGHAILSYNRQDSPAVDRLHRVLQAADIPVWRDTDLQPGQDWRLRIRQAITRDALAFIACFSPQQHGAA